MIDYSEATIRQLIVHHIGYKPYDEGCKLSENLLSLQQDNPLSPLLLQYFLKTFKPDIQYNFADPDINPVIQEVDQIFENAETITESSKKLAELLYETSTHPKIKAGDFYVANIDNVKLYGEAYRCIGLFKSETKETYLKVYTGDQKFGIEPKEGISIKKLDKGALIFRNQETGEYIISIVDSISKGDEAVYWKTDFLGLIPREDNFFMTQNYLSLCKDFVTDVYNAENRVDRSEQADLLNRSIDYFGKNKDFDLSDFESQVIENPETIKAFEDYREFYENERQIPLEDAFSIEPDAVKKHKRFFKSVIKLDKNFHVYVHGNKQLIERGYDQQKKMHFYQLYFDYEN
ncbi:nucleoid-associated protein [Saccharicrinis sp. FJH54]|uniref:nucleoid-associated protein n=1 Tax=Saccharicrinis sp. FJH54 TaxID=3344665 RepID=UPI0035D3EDF1